MHDIESEVVHKITDTDRNHNRLVRSDLRQRPPIEMIEMGMRNQNDVDRWQMMNLETRLLESLNHFQPFRPDRINQHIRFMRLNQERCVPNPSDADLPFPNLREAGLDMVSRSLGKKRRD